jgi:hypothetical protein
MYCLAPEKPLRLVYGIFYLAIGATFYESIKFIPTAFHKYVLKYGIAVYVIEW